MKLKKARFKLYLRLTKHNKSCTHFDGKGNACDKGVRHKGEHNYKPFKPSIYHPDKRTRLAEWLYDPR